MASHRRHVMWSSRDLFALGDGNGGSSVVSPDDAHSADEPCTICVGLKPDDSLVLPRFLVEADSALRCLYEVANSAHPLRGKRAAGPILRGHM
jgi:hypothetical protein